MDKVIVKYIEIILNDGKDVGEEVETLKFRDYWDIHKILQKKRLVVMVIVRSTKLSDCYKSISTNPNLVN